MIDLMLGLVLLMLFLPVIIVLFMVLLIPTNFRPFFVQVRPGIHGQFIKLVKFRTMNDNKSVDGSLLPDQERIFVLGRYIRIFSLDELPQIIHVVLGQMSLVGPRPLLVEYLPLYNETQSRRHEMRPGMTGWAQINGRNEISWQKRFDLDVWYVDNVSFWLDSKIFILTLIRVLSRQGVSPKSTVTMQKFKGN
ncbi:sugar transferase [Reichenbachiella sp.]|uniref:sugar transferase n=1 Tax=Reichenbachiella sp. TaxID=2184521 RepID=UPI003BAFE7E7